jgi:hypothetical protein
VLSKNKLPCGQKWAKSLGKGGQNMTWYAIYIYTVCPRRNVPDFGRMFLISKYTDITQNTYI